MHPDDFLRASHLILTNLRADTSPNDRVEGYAGPLNFLLHGKQGRDVQRILLELSIALRRREALWSVLRSLKNTVNDLEFEMFRATDSAGNNADALQVLTERLHGPAGFVATTQAEFTDIVANIGHMANDNSQEQARYWLRRAKQFKRTTKQGIGDYVQAAKTSIEATADVFSRSTSRTMNALLHLKAEAELQQTILVRAQAELEPFEPDELSVVDITLLEDFLYEAAADSDSILFTRRLHEMINRCLPLRVFVEPYGVMSTVSGRQWGSVQTAARGFGRSAGALFDDFSALIQEQIDVMDYHQAVTGLDIAELAEPFATTTSQVFEVLRLSITAWLEAVSELRENLQAELQGKQDLTLA